MPRFETTTETVARAIATEQIGTPVATRVVAHLSADHGTLVRFAARAIEISVDWLSAEPDQLTAFGGVDRGQISALISCPSGRSSLVSVGTCGLDRPLLEIVVWGTHGILTWEGERRTINPVADESETFGRTEEFATALQSSLAAGQTVEIPGGELRGPKTGHRTSRAVSLPTARMLRATKPPYGVLLVAGDHTHQPQYADGLVADGRCRLIALADEADVTPRRRRLNEQMAKRLDIPLLGDLGTALQREDVHIVSICSEPRRRGRIIVAAARAGKHLYLDKPFAASLADADAIVKAIDQTGVVSQMFSLIHSDTSIAIRKAVQSGITGDLSAVHFDLCFSKGNTGTARLGKRRKESPAPDQYEVPDSKRELSNVGVYPLVTLLSLLGTNVRRVVATTGNYFFEEHQRNAMEDFGQMLLQLDDGIVATVSAGRTGWRSHPASGLNRTTLTGSKCAMTFDAHEPRISVWADVECWVPPQRNPTDPMAMWGGAPKQDIYVARPRRSWITPVSAGKSDAQHFLDCVEAGRNSDVPASLAARTTEVLIAAYRSSAAGVAIDLPLDRK